MAYTKTNVTIIAYLIGIKMDIVRQIGEENPELIEKLMDNKSCRIIRYLCKLRTNLMMNFKNTDTEMRMNNSLKNGDIILLSQMELPQNIWKASINI